MIPRRWERLVVVGPGLIGGSIGLGARARGLAREVVAVGRSPRTLATVLAGGGADRVTTHLADGVRGADLVVLCAPVGALPGLVQEAWPLLDPGAVLTDAGSVKGEVVAAAAVCPPRPDVAFAGGHPMAGSERSGFAAASPDLFRGRLALVTREPDTPAPAVAAVTALWEGLGSHVRVMSADAHDRGVALISHLPHLVAYGLVAAADGEALALAAQGFLDTTRIAASPEALWADIFRANRAALLDGLGRFARTLARWEALVRAGDWGTLAPELGRAREVREKLA